MEEKMLEGKYMRAIVLEEFCSYQKLKRCWSMFR